jgi:hypothetical protein
MGITGPDRLVRCLSRRGRHVGGPRHLCSSSLCLTGWVTPSAGAGLPARWALGRGATAAPPVRRDGVVGRARFSYCWQARRHETRIHCSRANTPIALGPRPCARRDRPTAQRKGSARTTRGLFLYVDRADPPSRGKRLAAKLVPQVTNLLPRTVRDQRSSRHRVMWRRRMDTRSKDK